MKSKHIIFVPGIFGWGPGELRGFSYWGDALQQFGGTPFTAHWAKCGPLSSFHDRACEAFAHIKGTQVNYGAEHSANAGHAPTSRNMRDRVLVPDWSAENPVILVGHSAGAQTCLQLQQLLAEDFWKIGSDENWVEAIVSVAGVLNGSTLTYMFCDKKTGRLNQTPGFLIPAALTVVDLLRAAALPIHDLGTDYDLYLDQWTGKENGSREELQDYFNSHHSFADGEDNLAFDLSLQGCFAANQKFQTRRGTYYFSLVTRATSEVLGKQVPDATMNLLLLALGAPLFQALVNFTDLPIQGWGVGDLTIGKWRENDGAVSSISQRFPFTGLPQYLAGEGIFGREPRNIEKGKWYFEHVESIASMRFDHLDPVFGAKLKLIPPGTEATQRVLYQKLGTLLQSL